MSVKRNKPDLDELCRAIVCLRTPEEAAAFLEDICTLNEMTALAQRFRVAALLNDGEQYLRIVRDTGVSSATISRVNRCLKCGDGYRIVLDRMASEKAEKQD
ncbi:MAG: YerC/YecD family TrpR-related protein [Eubacteriales bacterium]